MIYIHIPISWDNPEMDRLDLFCSTLKTLQIKNKKVFIHCAKNYRVSIFMYHYKKNILKDKSAKLILPKGFKPNKTWRKIIHQDIYKKTNELNLEWVYNSDDINWNELSNLYKIAPLGDKKPNDLNTVFTNSIFKCFVYLDEVLIGVGRALADGFDCSYICDVAIHPDYQSKGIGKAIVNELIKLSQGHNKIILYSNPGKEQFYSKLGFDTMNTAMAIFKNKEQALEYKLTRKVQYK